MNRIKLWDGFVLLLCHGFALAALAAPQTATHSVTLGWTPDTQPPGVTVQSWNVYRSTVNGGPYNSIASVPAGTLTYVDAAVAAGNDYFYVVTGVDTAGAESAYSAPANATVPAGIPLSVATTALPSSVVGAAYAFTLSAAGGNPPYTWTGSGVPGLTVSPVGLLAGTLTQSGSFVSSLLVTDSTGGTAGASLSLIVTSPPPPPPPPTFPSGLVLYWPLDASDTTGGIAADQSGNSNAGAIVGNPLSVPGQLTQALNFANSGGYVAGTQFTGVFSTSLTLAAWIKTTTTSMYQTIFSKFDSSGQGAGYIFTVTDTGNLAVYIGGADILSPPYLANDATLIADGNWHQVVATISFEAQTVQFYVDGKLTSSTAMNMVPSGDGGATLRAGATSLGPWPNFFTGSMDDVQVYSRALTGAEVSAVFALTGGVTH